MDTVTRIPPAPPTFPVAQQQGQQRPTGWIVATCVATAVALVLGAFLLVARNDVARTQDKLAAATVALAGAKASARNLGDKLADANAALDDANGRTAACQQAASALKTVGNDLAHALVTLWRQSGRFPGGYLYTSYIRSVLSGVNVSAVAPALKAARTCANGAVTAL